jgi:bifunctional non-homologous end joining protein LigD
MRKARVAALKMNRSLTRYQQKRDFSLTAEPSGRVAVAPSKRLRFVIQKHDASHLHYDLRLELDGVFKSWAVTRGPSIDPAVKRLAVEVEDHPLDYGDFEGTIPKGQYGGGTVQLWDRGYWAPLGDKDPEGALKRGELKFTLAGERLAGSWVLVRLKQDRYGDKRINWLLIKHRDDYADADKAQALLAQDRSVASGRSMAQIAKGTGRSPKPFMVAGRPLKASAVWHSRSEEGVGMGPPARSASKVGKSPKAATVPVLAALPAFIEPQLCKLVARPPEAEGWAHEVKFDGYRAQLRVEAGNARLRTRSGLDWTKQFAAIARRAGRLPDCIIDGEVCALDHEQMPSFAALQAALSENRSDDLVYFAFDLLASGSEDLRQLPLHERKSRLAALLKKARAGDSIRYVEHFESTADTILLSACKMHLEGIVSKHLISPYVSGRSGTWTKAKCRAGHEVVIGGWTVESGQLRSLLAGVNRDGHLIYVGRIGTGYGAAVAAKLLPTLKNLTRESSPFAGANAPRKERNIRWLKPTLVAEIEFAGWTGSGMIRQASFKGLRRDKAAKDVVAEMPSPIESGCDVPDEKLAARVRQLPARSAPPATHRRRPPPEDAAARNATARVMGVNISKPDKVLWPEVADGGPVSKLALAHYFEEVGNWILPHVKGRPCSLLRAPDGIDGQQFFQRHAMTGLSNLFTLIKIKGDRAPYVQIDRIEALAAVAQIGALEIHPWNCAPDNPEAAGRLVFDLDPAPDVKFASVVAAALEIRERLKKVGLESFCKTTGGKGLHVVTPLKQGKDAIAWPAAKNFAHLLCVQMAQDSPTKYLDRMSKKERQGRIFLDYLRNDRTATAVAVLSPRARAGAPVSMPLAWVQVKSGLEPNRYTVRSAPAILKRSDPWAGYAEAARPLNRAIRQATS